MKERSRISPPSPKRAEWSLCTFPVSIVSALLIGAAAQPQDRDQPIPSVADTAMASIEETQSEAPSVTFRAEPSRESRGE